MDRYRIGKIIGAFLGTVGMISFALSLLPEEPKIQPPPPGKPWRNAILISVDTLRQDGLQPAGYDRPTSPVMNRFAREAVMFPNGFAPAPWTMPSHASMLTGLYPTSHQAITKVTNNPKLGVSEKNRLSDDVQTITETFWEAGYHTAAFTNHAWFEERFGLNQGFEVYKNADWYFDIQKTVPKVLDWLDTRPARPFFLLLHFYDPHIPYMERQPYTDQFSPERYTLELKGVLEEHDTVLRYRDPSLSISEDNLARMRAFYDGEVRHTDYWLGRIFAALEAQGLLEDTIIIFVSDHGEEFKEHGRIGHDYSLYDEMIRVPYYVRFPSGEQGGRVIEDQVSLVDIAPTMFEWTGVKGSELIQGVSLYPLLREAHPTRIIFAERYNFEGRNFLSAQTPEWKLIKTEGNDGTEFALYDLRRDPGEQDNVATENPHMVEFLKFKIDEWRKVNQQLSKHVKSGTDVEIPPELREQIQAMGYLND